MYSQRCAPLADIFLAEGIRSQFHLAYLFSGSYDDTDTLFDVAFAYFKIVLSELFWVHLTSLKEVTIHLFI